MEVSIGIKKKTGGSEAIKYDGDGTIHFDFKLDGVKDKDIAEWLISQDDMQDAVKKCIRDNM